MSNTIVELGNKLEIAYEKFNFTEETKLLCRESAHQISKNLTTSRDIKKQTEFLKLSLTDRTEFLRFLAVTCEVADIFSIMNKEGLERGVYDDNYQKIHNFSVGLFDEIKLNDHRPIPKDKFQYFRQIVRCSLVSINEDYRIENFSDCIEKIQLLIQFVEEKLIISDFECLETLARLNYYLGKNQRKRGHTKQAEISYKQALVCLNEFAQYIRQGLALSLDPASSSDNERERYARRIQATCSKCAIVEVSRAWLFFDKGEYVAAEHSALASLTLLVGTEHLIIKNHALLVLGTIKRVNSTNFEEMEKSRSIFY